MEIYGCGYNGFGQLLPASPKRSIFSPVKIFQDFFLDTNHKIEEMRMRSASEKKMKLTSSWSTVHVLSDSKIWWQGFYSGKKSGFKTLEMETDELKRNPVADMDSTCEKLYYTTVDGECIAVDIGTGQRLKVKDGEQGLRTRFLKVAVGDRNKVALTDGYLAGFISSENSNYIFRLFDCAVKFSQVDCGKEHVILLSQTQQVYSVGLGSRGQLGHGTTDGESQPRLLEALGSVPVDTISAGGWHSAAVSAIGDIYVWGWNESGQLGFPMQGNSQSQETTQDLPADKSDDHQPGPDEPRSGVKRTSDQHREEAKWIKKMAISKESTESSSTLSQSPKAGHLKLIKEGFETSKRSHGNQPRIHCQKAHQPTSPSSLPDADFHIQVAAETNSPLNEAISDQSYGSGDKSSWTKNHECHDSRDPVLFQALPKILDLPNGGNVFKVSCGSRHTAAISEGGCLYTWGWGAYGQLGLGDTLTRDIPTLVECLREDQQVMDVFCGAWNTLIKIRITSHE